MTEFGMYVAICFISACVSFILWISIVSKWEICKTIFLKFVFVFCAFAVMTSSILIGGVYSLPIDDNDYKDVLIYFLPSFLNLLPILLYGLFRKRNFVKLELSFIILTVWLNSYACYLAFSGEYRTLGSAIIGVVSLLISVCVYGVIAKIMKSISRDFDEKSN